MRNAEEQSGSEQRVSGAFIGGNRCSRLSLNAAEQGRERVTG